MIWEYCPIGMSFPVSDDTVETKKHCWSIALSALRAGGNWNGTELLECLQQGKPGSADREYLCILYQNKNKTAVIDGGIVMLIFCFFQHSE